jgi:hypothetical protein
VDKETVSYILNIEKIFKDSKKNDDEKDVQNRTKNTFVLSEQIK